MAKGVTVRVEGLKEIDAALAELPKATGRNVMRRVGLKRMQPIAETMRQLAPDDPATGGNDLKASINVTTKKPKRHRRESEVEIYAGPDRRPAGVQQEFGNQHHGPQPFVRPAWDQHEDGLLPGLADDFWPELKKAADRQARKTARLAAKG